MVARDDCALVVADLKRLDPERALQAVFAPARLRPAVAAVLGLDLEAARVFEQAREPAAQLMRITWWRDAVREALSGRPPAQPLLRLLARCRPGLAELAPALERMLAAREAFAAAEAAELTVADALTRAKETGGLVNRLLVRLALEAEGRRGPREGAALERAAEDVGTAHRLMRYVLGVQREARAGRLWLPGLDADRRVRIPARQVTRGPWPEELRGLVKALTDEAAGALRAGLLARPGRLSRGERIAFILSAFTLRDIAALRAAGHDPLAAVLGRLGAAELWRVWRAAILGPPRRWSAAAALRSAEHDHDS